MAAARFRPDTAATYMTALSPFHRAEPPGDCNRPLLDIFNIDFLCPALAIIRQGHSFHYTPGCLAQALPVWGGGASTLSSLHGRNREAEAIRDVGNPVQEIRNFPTAEKGYVIHS